MFNPLGWGRRLTAFTQRNIKPEKPIQENWYYF